MISLRAARSCMVQTTIHYFRMTIYGTDYEIQTHARAWNARGMKMIETAGSPSLSSSAATTPKTLIIIIVFSTHVSGCMYNNDNAYCARLQRTVLRTHCNVPTIGLRERVGTRTYLLAWLSCNRAAQRRRGRGKNNNHNSGNSDNSHTHEWYCRGMRRFRPIGMKCVYLVVRSLNARNPRR